MARPLHKPKAMMPSARGSKWLFLAPFMLACTGEISGPAVDGPVCAAPKNCFELCVCSAGEPLRCRDACGDDITPIPDPGTSSGGTSSGTGGSGATAGNPGSGGSSGGQSGGAPSSGGTSSGGASSSGGSGSGPLPTTGDLARGLSIQSVAIYQGTKVTLFEGGSAVSDRNAPVVSGRDALVRVFVSPEAGFSSREIVASLDLGNGPTLDAKRVVSGGSTDGSLSSTFNINVPAARITPGLNVSVSLLEAAASNATGSTDGARAPSSGTAPLGASATGGALEVVLVPLVVNGIQPDVSAARVQEYKDYLYRLYPVPEVKVTVRNAVTHSNSVSGKSGSSWNSILDKLLSVRSSDKPASQKYYYGVLTPQQSFSQYCAGGCIAGMSPVAKASDVWARGSVGLGFFPTGGYSGSGDTMAHEIGHAHGLPHAPCGTSNAGPFPYTGGKIGVWGYDLIAKKLIDPSKYKDVMSYCDPTWFSDYNFDKLFTRQQAVHGSADFIVPDVRRAPGRYRTLLVEEDGSVSWGQDKDLGSSPLGDERTIEVKDDSGNVVGKVTGFDYPVSHYGGSMILVRQSSLTVFPKARRLRPTHLAANVKL